MTISAICDAKQQRILCRTTMKAESSILAEVPGCNWSKPNEAYAAPLSPAMAAELWMVARRAGMEMKADAQFRALILDHRRILAQASIRSTAEGSLEPIPLTKTRAWHHQLQAYHFCYPLQSAYLALEMGCLVQDTMILLTCGVVRHRVTIKRAFEMYRDLRRIMGKSVFTECYGDSRFGMNRIERIIQKGVKPVLKIVLENGMSLRCTGDHEIGIPGGFRRADRLALGDNVICQSSPAEKTPIVPAYRQIRSIEPDGEDEVYDIVMVDPYRNFVANGIVVHNCGKSKVTVDLIANRQHRKSLIVCPASVIQEWPRQFTAHCGVPILVAPLGDKVGSVADKVAAAKLAFYEAERADLPVVLVTNYESVWRPPFGPIYDDEGERIVKKGFALEQNWDLVACDEIHRISSASGRASRFMAKLTQKAKFRLGLSGTPMGSGPLSVYGQYRFLDPGIFGANHKDFKERFAVIGGFNGGQVLGHKNLEELNRKFYSIAFRVKSRDVLDLPAETHIDRKCKLCPKAKAMYKQFERDLIIQIESGEVTAKNALVKLLRLQQMTSGYARLDPTADEEGETVHIDDSKKSLLREILEDIDPAQPVVVFARFTHDLEAVRDVTEKLGRRYMELSGKIKQTEDWRAGGAEVLGVQIRAGGVGIDLTRSNLCIYYSLGYSLIDKLQSMARQMRPGQKHPVTYYYLISEGTVDEEVYRALSKKEDVVEAVLSMLTRHA